MTPTVEKVYKNLCGRRQLNSNIELPAERVLALQLGVSRRVIREALQELRTEDILVQGLGRKRFLKSKKGHGNEVAKKELQIGIIFGRPTAHLLCNEVLLWTSLLQNDKHHPILLPLGSWPDRRYNQCKILPYKIDRLDGVLALDVWLPPAIRWIEGLGCPVVSMDHPTASRHIVDYLPDERRGCKKLARFLKQNSVRSAHYFDFYNATINPVRSDAFTAAMIEENISVKGQHPVSFVESEANSQIRSILKSLKPNQALFCVNKVIADFVDNCLQSMNQDIIKSCHLIVVSDAPFQSQSGISVSSYSRNSLKSTTGAYHLLVDLIHNPNKSRRKQKFPIVIHKFHQRK